MEPRPKGANRIVRETRELLVETFPQTFMPAGAPKRPLAFRIGEYVALALPEIGQTRIANALLDYTEGKTYLSACVLTGGQLGIEPGYVVLGLKKA